MGITDLGKMPDPLSKPSKGKARIDNQKLFEVASGFYDHMSINSKWNQDLQTHVWEGSMSRWFIDNGLRHLYSPVTRVLYAAGCCNLASRGGGTRPSLVHLHHAPTLQEVATLRDNEFFFERDALTGKARERYIEQMVNDMRQQIADLKDRVERLEHGNR